MRHRSPLLAVAVGGLLAVSCTPARAAVSHTVSRGESLWGLAAQQNLTTRALAVFNGLAPDAQVVAGATVRIPTVAEAAGALSAAPTAARTTPATGSPPGPPPMGAYTVHPGDTLSGLALSSRVPTAQIAQMNGLDPAGLLIAGTVVKLPTGASTPVRAATPAPASRVAPAPPAATPGRVSASDIATVATRNGVPAPLSSAIAWQESGFNNAMVSSANARGVMQVMPGTWDWVQQNLARRHLDAASPIDNVGAGVLYLGSLLRGTGGDQALAAAAYYQGLSSVRAIGMLPETRSYVTNVMALRSRFGG